MLPTTVPDLPPPPQVRALADLDGSPYVVRYYAAWLEPHWEKLGQALRKAQDQGQVGWGRGGWGRGRWGRGCCAYIVAPCIVVCG